MKIISQLIWVLAAVYLMQSYAVATEGAVAIAPVSVSAPVFPPNIETSAEAMQYFRLGLYVGDRTPALLSHLDEFERRIALLYGDLALALKEYKEVKKLGLFDQIAIKLRVRSAHAKLREAESSLFDSLNVPLGAEKMLPSAYFNDGAARVFSPQLFQEFLNGIYKKNGRYISVRSGVIEYGSLGGRVEVRFPEFCFSSGSEEKTFPIPAHILAFLRTKFDGLDKNSLYYTDVTHFRETVMHGSRQYAQTGIADSCGGFGDVVSIGGESRVQLFMSQFSKTNHVKKFQDFWVESVRAHEIMHYLFRQNRYLCTADPRFMVSGKLVTFNQLNEAQATIAAAAVFADAESTILSYLLIRLNSIADQPAYILVHDIFLRKLFSILVYREIIGLQDISAQSGGRETINIPTYAKIRSTSHLGASNADPATFSFTLKSSGFTNDYIVKFDRETVYRNIKPLFNATPADILTTANDALKELATISKCP